MGRLAEVNSNVVLAVTLWDANTTKGVRARVFNSAGTEVSGSPFTLTHRTAGHYTGTGWNPTVEGQYSVSYEVYTDGTFATPDRRYEWGAEEVEVRSIDQDLATLLSRLTAGRATNLDNLDATISSRLTTTTFNTVVGTPVTSVSADIASVKSDTNTLNATKITTARANNLDNLDATVSSRATQTSVTAIDTKLGTPVGASVSVDIASVKSDTNTLNTTKITTTRANNLDNLDTTITSRLATTSFDTVVGTPVTSVSADIAAVKSDTSSTKTVVDTNLNATVSSRATQTSVDNINTKLGTPTGASISVDIAAVKSDTSSTKTVVDTNLNATVASRSTQVSVDAVKAVVDTINIETDATSIATAVWSAARGSYAVSGSFGEAHQGVVSTARANNLDNLDTTISSRSTAVALAAVQADTDDIQAKIGTPTGASISVDVAAVKSDTGSIKSTVDTNLNATVASRSTQVSVDAVKTVVDAINIETDAASIAAAVWNTAKAGHTTAGTFGESNQGVVSVTRANNLDNLDATVSTRATQTSVNAVQADTDDIQAKIGTPAGVSVSADIAAVKSDTSSTKTVVDTNLNTTVSSRASAAALATVQSDTDDIQARIGTPSVTLAADIASVKSDTSGLRTDYTTVRADRLDNLDATISSRASAGSVASVQADTDDIQAKLGTPVGASVSADIAAVKADTGSTKTVVDTNLNATVGSRATQTSVNAIQADTDDIQAKIGSPVVTVATDIAAVKSDTSSTKTVVDTNLNTTVSSRATQLSVDAVKTVVDAINIETDAASIATAVWNRARAGHVVAGSFGESNQGVVSAARAALLDNLDTAVSTRASASALASVQADTDDIQAKIGTPVATVATDIAAVKSDTSSTKTVVDTNLNATVASRATQTSLDAAQATNVSIKAKTDQLVFTGGRVDSVISSTQEDTLVDKIWDEAMGGHVAVGTTGYNQQIIDDIKNVVDGLSVADTNHAVLAPQTITIPAVGTETYRIYTRNMKLGVPYTPTFGPDIRIEEADGSTIVDWTAMTLDSVGIHYYDYTVSAGQIAEQIIFKMRHKDEPLDDYFLVFATANLTHSEGDLADIIATTNAIKAKTDQLVYTDGRVDAVISTTQEDALVDKIWDEDMAGHGTTGTGGYYQLVTAQNEAAVTTILADTSAIKAKTNQLNFTGANVDARAVTVVDKTDYALSPTNQDSIVDKVWDETLSAHLSSGTAGKTLFDADATAPVSLNPASINDIADAVWNEPMGAHTLPGTVGQKLEQAGTILPSELEDIAVAVWDSQLVDFNDPGSMGYNVNRIDNIEADMAKAGDTAKQVDLLTVKTVQSNLVSSFSDFRSVYTDLRGAKLDNLDTSVSSRASQGSVTAGFADTAKDTTVAKATQVSAVQTSVNAVQTSVNALQSDVTSVKGSVQSTGVVVSTASQDSIVDKVWDESAAAHVAPGTMGYDQSVAASGVITPGDISNIAVAVWDESLAAHSVPGSASEIVKTVTAVKTDTTDLLGRLNPTRAANLDNLDAAITSRESEAAASARAANDTLNHNQIISELGDIETKVDTINAKLGTPAPSVGGALSALAASVASVQAKTNNLPSDPASASGVTAAIAPAIAAATQANATSLAVKAKTDNLPADPAKESSVLAVPTNPVLATDGRLTNLDAPITSRAKPSDLAPLATTAQLVAVESALTSDIAGVALGVAQTAKPSDVAAATSGMALEATSQQIKSTLNSVQGAQITPNDVWTYGARTLTAPVDTTTDLSALATSAQLAAAAAQMTNDLTVWSPKLTVAIQPTTDEITLVAWLTEDGQLVTDADSAEVTVLDSDDNVAFAVGPDMFVSANGLFKFTRANASTVVARNNTYACKIVITKGGNDYVDIVPITVF